MATLCDAGASMEVADLNGRAPLHEAAVEGHAHVCAELLARGVHVDPTTFTGATPAFFSAEAKHKATTLVLGRFGANIFARCTQGDTPLVLADAHGWGDDLRSCSQVPFQANSPAVEAMTDTWVKLVWKAPHCGSAPLERYVVQYRAVDRKRGDAAARRRRLEDPTVATGAKGIDVNVWQTVAAHVRPTKTGHEQFRFDIRAVECATLPDPSKSEDLSPGARRNVSQSTFTHLEWGGGTDPHRTLNSADQISAPFVF